MKIPKYMHEPMHGFTRYGLDVARKALEIEAVLYRAAGRKDAAAALRQVAIALKRVSKGTATMAEAFQWPAQTGGESQ
jgi:hypothetical protein